MKYIASLFFVVLLLTACNKERLKKNETSVKGTVVDKLTFSKIPGSLVSVVKTPKSNPSIHNLVIVSQQTTDTNAAFVFKFKHDDDYSYYVLAQKSPYFYEVFTYINSGQKNEVTVYLSPPAYIQLNLKNTHPFDVNDKIEIVAGYGVYPSVLIGSNIDTSLIFANIANRTNTVSCKVTRNSVDSVFSYNLYTPAYDTVSLDIFY